MVIAKASEIKNNFGYYLDAALVDKEVLISRHGRIVAKLVAVESGQYIVEQKNAPKVKKAG